jgi:cytochrome c biogenesis factor
VTVVGELALWVALFLAVWGSVASLGGATLHRPELVASGVRSVVASAAMIVLACLGLWAALLTHDFSLEYVASHTTLNTPTLYLITAFWAGPAGALLSFALALSVFAAVAASGRQRPEAELLPWVAGALAALLALVLVAGCFSANPYERIKWVPGEGQGLNPRLQTPLAMPYYLAIHGAYGAAAVAVALAVAGAVSRRTGPEWFRAVRGWSILCWCLLTGALAVHMRWAYLQPTAGGLWRLDLAQVAHAVAWLGAFALVRSLGARGDTPLSPPIASRLRSVGAVAVYVGLAGLVTGIGARRVWRDEVVTLHPGEATERSDPFRGRWRFISQGVSRDERMNYLATGVALEVWRDGRNAGIISAERRQYLDSVQRPTFEPAVKPGILSSLRLDVYAVLAEVRGEAAQLRVGFRPLVACVWVGWILIAAGGLATATGGSRGPVARADVGSTTA